MVPTVTASFDESTCTISCIVSDPDTGKAAIIDSVLDFDAKSGRTSTTSVDKILAHLRENQLEAEWTIDTFVKMPRERDEGLELPTLILPSVQVNIRAGRLPPPEDNGIAYLKLPLNAL